MIPRNILSAFVAALLGGCSEPPTAPPPALESTVRLPRVDLVGTYELEARNGAPLPIMVATGNQQCDYSGCVPTGLSTWLISGSLTLAADGTVTRISTYKTATDLAVAGEVSTGTQHGTYGAYALGRAVVLKFGSALESGVVPVTEAGALHLSMTPAEVFRYQR